MAVDWNEGFQLPEAPSSHTVTSPNGVSLDGLNDKERDFYVDIRDKILTSYTFTDPSDMADLDRILLTELAIYRVNVQLLDGKNDLGFPLASVDQRRLHQSLSDLGGRLAKDKDALGISKSAREKDSQETVAGYIDNLRKRALEFGVHRNEQAQLSIALLQEVLSIVDTFQRANELERSKMGMREPDDILNWITDKVGPQLYALDTGFIQANQRYWVEDI